MSREIVQSRNGLREVRSLAFTQLAGVLDGLFHPRYVGTDFVESALDRGDAITLLSMEGALLLDGSFSCALIRQCRLHGDLALAHRAVMDLDSAVEVAHPQGQQLRREATLGILQRLVPARRGRLTL